MEPRVSKEGRRLGDLGSWELKGGNLWLPTFLPTLVQGEKLALVKTSGGNSLTPAPTQQLLNIHCVPGPARRELAVEVEEKGRPVGT